jgi:hypothetical protein
MRIPRHVTASGVFALVAAMSALPLLAQELALKYNWPKGEELRYQFTAESTSTMSGLPTGDMTIDTTVVQVHQMTGDGVAADGAATVRIRIESIKTTTSSPMGSVSYDSAAPASAADPGAAQVAGVYGPMIGATLTAVMAPNGMIRSLEGMAKLTLSAQAVQQAAAGLGMAGGADLMNDEAMKSTYQNFGSLPDKPVKPGDTWKTEFTIPNPLGTQTVSSTFTVKGVETLDGREVVRIGAAETIKTAPGGMMGPMSVQAGVGTGQGDVWFNAKLGRLERCTIEVAIPMTMSLTLPDGTSLSLQSSSKSKTTVQLVAK